MGQPKAKKRIGGITMTLWENEWKGEKAYSYTFQRSYKKKDTGEWVNTEFFNPSDLLNLAALAQETAMSNIKKDVISAKQPSQVERDLSTKHVKNVQEEFGGQEYSDQDIPF